MFLQKSDEFPFEIHFLVMLFLIQDVGDRFLQLRRADGKSSITLLPSEISDMCFAEPFGRASFDQLCGFGNIDVGR